MERLSTPRPWPHLSLLLGDGRRCPVTQCGGGRAGEGVQSSPLFGARRPTGLHCVWRCVLADLGWFKLYRKMRENFLWRLKPFSQGQAWVDLLMRVNFSDRPIPQPGRVGPRMLHQGEAIVSLRGLAVNWGWSKGKVQRYLQCLRNEHMIESTNEYSYTRVKLLNWKKYQPDVLPDGSTNRPSGRPTDGTPTDPHTGQQRDSDGSHQENVEKDENEKKARRALRARTRSRSDRLRPQAKPWPSNTSR